MKDYYVILTGSKNNAGDFLIKHRAIQLLNKLRPDKGIIDLNAWELFDSDKLDIVNKSKAVLLLGGPSVQMYMRPKIYKMTSNLDDIKAPIIAFGIGWKSASGQWKDTHDYKLNKESLQLLSKINKSGFISSVRDYHTLNFLRLNGLNNFVMTGCPAYYDLNFINKKIDNGRINKIAFSLGVNFIKSVSFEQQTKKLILLCKEKFIDKDFEVVFHHSLDKEKYFSSHSSNLNHYKKHNKFANWLNMNKIKFYDISGSAENLINFYSKVDFHIGYRVHAHIFMNSISKYSILISEDGRAKGVYSAIGGLVLDSYFNLKKSFFSRIMNKLSKNHEIYEINKRLPEEVISNYDYEYKTNFVRIKNARNQIDNNFLLMKEFIKQLP